MAGESAEQQVPQSEQRAEEMLSPENRIRSRVRANITGPLDNVDLPDDKKKIILDYSDLAAEAAVEEFERLKAESPAERLKAALSRVRETAEDTLDRRVIEGSIDTLNQSVAIWRNNVVHVTGGVALHGGLSTKTGAVERLIGQNEKSTFRPWREDQSPTRFNFNHQGIYPRILLFDTPFPERQKTEFSEERVSQIESVLRELGFLPENVGIDSLLNSAEPLKEPEKGWSREEIDRLRFGDKVVSVWNYAGQPRILGIKTPSTPGVTAEIARNPAGYSSFVTFHFSPEAVARSLPTIPAVLEPA